MHPSLSMNQILGPVDYDESRRRTEAQARMRQAYDAAEKEALRAELGSTSNAVGVGMVDAMPLQQAAEAERHAQLGGLPPHARGEYRMFTPTPEEAQRANEAARRAQAAINSPRPLDGYGFAQGGVAQQFRAPSKMYPRSDILAILKAHKALSLGRPFEMNERDMLNALIHIFENLE